MFKKLGLFLFILALVPALAFGQTRGKIAGVVTDKATGEPLPGVNIIIENTTLGASTDIDGYYVILNVPVGGHTVRASYIGYKDMIVQGVRVSVDLTTELNFELEPTTLELGESIVVTADRPLVRKDETNTNIIKTAEEIQVMPIRGVQDLVSTTAGVVKQENENEMNIRGGRGSESAVYVDGVMVNDPYNFAVRTYVPNEAIEEISVQTGGFNAEYGEAMSGIILLTTNSGAQHYFGSLQAITDEFLDPENKTLGTYSYGYNEYIATLGGPIIPGTNHTFFFSGTRRYLQDNTPSWGWAENDMKPEEFQSAIIPGNSSSDWSYTGKVKFQLAQTMELKSSLVWTDRTFSDINTTWLYAANHAPEWKTEHRSVNATFTHTPMPTTYYDLKFNYFETYREQYDRFFEDNLFAYGDPYQTGWTNVYRDSSGNITPGINDVWGVEYSSRLEPDFLKPGSQYNDYFKNKTSYWGIDFDITHQQGKNHTFKAGFEYKYHTLREYRVLDPVRLALRDAPNSEVSDLELYQGADVRFYGYDVNGNEVDNGDFFGVSRDAAGNYSNDAWMQQEPYHPIIMSGYLQDKIEFADLILNLGLRYDRIDPNAWQFKNLAAEYDKNDVYVQGSGMFGGNNQFDQGDIEESEVHQFVSPRLGVSFPVSENTIFHAQYGKFYQAPQLADLYLSPFYLDRYVNAGGYFTTLDNPNLNPPKTTSYEIGFKQRLGQFASLQATAFYKETEDLVQVLPVQTDVTTIAFTYNGDFGVIKGFDLIMNLRRYKNISASVNYELQFATGTGSASASNFDIAWQRGGKGNFPKFTMPLDFEQRHTGSINLDYRLGNNKGPQLMGMHVLQNTGLNLLFSFNSGQRYTRMFLFNTIPFTGRYDNDNLSETPVSAINAETMPWNYRLDMKLDRSFMLPIMDTELTAYVWVLNVLNTRNVQDVWITTGLPGDTGYRSTTGGQAYFANNPGVERQFSMREMDWVNYGIPRQIRLGLQLNF
ncbi:MAG: TonB-dependent receptor [Calditrichia bacterium]